MSKSQAQISQAQLQMVRPQARDIRVGFVKIADLIPAKHNPKRRTQKLALKKLLGSIQRKGLIYPILIDKEKHIVEGHRRVAVHKLLGMDEIQAITVSGDRDAIYADVNDSNEKMSGNDYINIYLINPAAVPDKQRKTLDQMLEVLDLPLLERLADYGGSPAYYKWAREIATYCEKTGNIKFIRKTLRWMMKHKTSVLVLNAARMGVPASTIYRAVNDDRRLAPTFKLA